MRRAPLIALLFAALTIGGAAGSERARSADTYAPLAVYNEAMSIVRDQYVDEVPWPKLVGDGVAGMVETIDADGALLGPPPSPEPASAARPGDGDVGIVLARRGGAPVVIATRDGMPARAAGLRSGDAIVKIDGVTTQSMLAADAAARLRGRPGTEVALSVARTGWAEPKSVALTRAKPPADSISHRDLGAGIAYVRIPVVRDTTAAEIGRLLDAPAAERPSGVVLDVRNTAGGEVPAAVAVAGLFLDPGCVVARVESRLPREPRELLAPTGPGRHDQAMAVLVDHGTESAAEILAGALQDWGRAVVVGAPTFGDASAQSVIPLTGERTLSLTTARYLTPKAHAISGKGIAPDVAASAPASADLEPAATTAKPDTDPAVHLAFDLVKAARIVDHPRGSTPGAKAGDAPRWCASPAA